MKSSLMVFIFLFLDFGGFGLAGYILGRRKGGALFWVTFAIERRSAIVCCRQCFYDDCYTNASGKLVTRGGMRTDCVGQLCDEKVVTTERVMQIHIHPFSASAAGTNPFRNQPQSQETIPGPAQELGNHCGAGPGARKPLWARPGS